MPSLSLFPGVAGNAKRGVMVTAHPVPILSDNYAWLLRDQASGDLGIVDPAVVEPVAAAIDSAIAAEGGRLALIVLTHHHGDHIAGAEAIRERYGARIVGAAADKARLPRLDVEVAENSEVELGHSRARVMETPGHTVGHVSYVFAEGGVLLCGDTLFSLGCGRLLEGTPAQMFESLKRLAALPSETLVCCGHEYTLSNARFARSIDPDNEALRAFAERAQAVRDQGQPTVPSRIADERACNPFVRAADVDTFADLRRRKDVA